MSDTMEIEKIKNVAEMIGNLILSGYRIDRGEIEQFGHCRRMTEVVFKKRFGYRDNDGTLKGFDETIVINTNSKEMMVYQMEIKENRQY